MNNFRLTNYSNKIPSEFITKDERNSLFNAAPVIEYLWDGRVRKIDDKKIIFQHESSIYIVINSNGEKFKFVTLSEVADFINCHTNTVSKHLDVESSTNETYTTEIKGYKIKRVRVYIK